MVAAPRRGLIYKGGSVGKSGGARGGVQPKCHGGAGFRRKSARSSPLADSFDLGRALRVDAHLDGIVFVCCGIRLFVAFRLFRGRFSMIFRVGCFVCCFDRGV